MKFDLQHKRFLRTFAGLVLGAGVTSLLADPCLYFSSTNHWEVALPHYRPEAIAGSLGTASFAITLVVPLGLIAHAVLYALNLRAVCPYLAVSAVGGLGLGVVLGPEYMTLPAWLLCIVCGVLCGLIAWLVRRPDRDNPVVIANPDAA